MEKSSHIAISVYLLALVLLSHSAFGGNRIVSWGNNVEPPRNSNVEGISAGLHHSLAFTEDGELLAWGDNSFGQSEVSSIRVRAVAAGGWHSLAITDEGNVVAWGNNGSGQTSVPGLAANNAIAVSAGFLHSLALRNNGRVVAWGDSQFGQIFVPPTLSHVVQISAGAFHNVALRSMGDVVVWGDNTHWNLLIPEKARSGVIAVAAGYYHTLALTEGGEVIAWGDNEFGQCDVPEAARSNVVSIAAGQSHSLALLEDGEVVVWGQRDLLLGARRPGGLARGQVSAIAAGGAHSLALVPHDADSNGNGIPDWWLLEYGLDPLAAVGPDHDSDGDGFSDVEEYIAGTNPSDASCFLRMTVVPGQDGVTRSVQVESASRERVYLLEVAVDLSNDEWRPMHVAMSMNGEAEGGEFVLNTSKPFGIFRIRASLP
ncbi:MAG TPA: hypothetical protein PKA76_02540 [Pirellulaceae bacterium]|nr:hypothetical protein [Pirellulaceae bacterium]